MKISKYLVSIVLLTLSSYAFAGCPSGTFGIYFTNNTNTGMNVQVQDYLTGKALTPSQAVPANNGGTTLCFSEEYTGYKLMQYLESSHLVYNISKQTLVNNKYFMSILATDSNFH